MELTIFFKEFMREMNTPTFLHTNLIDLLLIDVT